MPRKHLEKWMSRSLGLDAFHDLAPVIRLFVSAVNSINHPNSDGNYAQLTLSRALGADTNASKCATFNA